LEDSITTLPIAVCKLPIEKNSSALWGEDKGEGG